MYTGKLKPEKKPGLPKWSSATWRRLLSAHDTSHYCHLWQATRNIGLDTSLSGQVRLLEQQVRRNFAAIELADLPKEERGMTEDLLRSLAEAKLDVRDYEFAETRAEQAT